MLSEAIQMQKYNSWVGLFEKFAIYSDFKSIILDLTLGRLTKYSQLFYEEVIPEGISDASLSRNWY